MHIRTVAFICLLLGLLGFIDAGYLTIKHYTQTPLGCSLIEGCEKVTTSEYATVGNVPVALLGVLYYAFVVVGAAVYLQTKKSEWIKAVMIVSPVGAVASAWLVYLQLAVIGAICLYCMASALISFMLLGIDCVYIKIKNWP